MTTSPAALDPQTQIASRQSGALAFRAALVALIAQHREGIKEGKDYQPTVFVPALRQAFGAHMQGAAAVGFWDAFGAWLSQTLEGCEIDLDRWDVLRDLEIEEDAP